jgi:hypothetical protein
MRSVVAKGSYRTVDPNEASGRYHRARNLLRQAKDLAALAAGDQDAVGIMDLCVNAAIAFTDALTIRHAGIQNNQDHQAAPHTLEIALGKKAEPQQVSRLKRLLNRKGAIQYDHRPLRLDEAIDYLQQTERFGDWASTLFQSN